MGAVDWWRGRTDAPPGQVLLLFSRSSSHALPKTDQSWNRRWTLAGVAVRTSMDSVQTNAYSAVLSRLADQASVGWSQGTFQLWATYFLYLWPITTLSTICLRDSHLELVFIHSSFQISWLYCFHRFNLALRAGISSLQGLIDFVFRLCSRQMH